MGNFLDTPKTEESGADGTFKCDDVPLEYAVSCIQGWRASMEDAHFHHVSLPANEAAGTPAFENISFFAVFDGHAGSATSTFAAEESLTQLQQMEEYKGLAGAEDQAAVLKVCLEKLFPKLDEVIKTNPEHLACSMSGSTAISVMITPQSLIFANCGDSRALLVRNNAVKFFTKDHKPVDPEEERRVINAGGCVRMRRVNGDLAVSRALGDFSFKKNERLPPAQQMVSSVPDVTVVPRDNEGDQFVLLACDGVWDVMSNDEVCEFVLSKMKIGYSLRQVCKALVHNCLRSRDNVSVLIVALPAVPKTLGTLRPEDIPTEDLGVLEEKETANAV